MLDEAQLGQLKVTGEVALRNAAAAAAAAASVSSETGIVYEVGANKLTLISGIRHGILLT